MAERKPQSPSKDNSATKSDHYTVLARRYRPRQFSELIGQEHVAQALTNALKSNRVAHAYLFTGNRGVGKTSTARILAKALNCVEGPTTTPCDKCDICKSIAEGEDFDVLEIDGASNRGIDEIREIRQNVNFRPSRARYKIYIIDEVHMLTRDAFNALLKTLEEPPEHVKFFFATTEAQKVPVTILSRCQRFDFAAINVKNLVAQLQTIVTSEDREAQTEALELVARRAGGSMRDAESILDQLLAFTNEKLTTEQVQGLLGIFNDERITTLVQSVVDQQPAQVLRLLSQAVDDGLDLQELLNQLIEYWRDLMVVNCAGTEGQSLSVAGAFREQLADQAKGLSLDSILAGLEILVNTKTKLGRGTQHGRVLAEMALVRLSRLGELQSLSEIAAMLKSGLGAPPTKTPTTAGSTRPPGRLTGTETSSRNIPASGKKKVSP